MTKDERARRAALLCCHLTRNLAYYHAGWHQRGGAASSQFWLTVLGNFIDVSILEWVKLFGDNTGKHHWTHLVKDKASFQSRCLTFADITQDQWDAAWAEIKIYRDKFIAHLDSDDTMNIPHMDIPHRMVTFYYQELRRLYWSDSVWGQLPENISQYYDDCYQEAAQALGSGLEVMRLDSHMST